MIAAVVSTLVTLLITVVLIGQLRERESKQLSRRQLMRLTLIPLAMIVTSATFFLDDGDPDWLLVAALGVAVEIWLLWRASQA